jgi:hypothetical protein
VFSCLIHGIESIKHVLSFYRINVKAFINHVKTALGASNPVSDSADFCLLSLSCFICLLLFGSSQSVCVDYGSKHFYFNISLDLHFWVLIP